MIRQLYVLGVLMLHALAWVLIFNMFNDLLITVLWRLGGS